VRELDAKRCAGPNVWNCFQFAEAELAIGDFTEPKAAIRSTNDLDIRDSLLRRSVDELVASEDVFVVLPMAAEMAWEIQDPSLRVHALIALLGALKHA